MRYLRASNNNSDRLLFKSLAGPRAPLAAALLPSELSCVHVVRPVRPPLTRKT
mgnify:CR=1 FL=1